jgi:hypothetical protein
MRVGGCGLVGDIVEARQVLQHVVLAVGAREAEGVEFLCVLREKSWVRFFGRALFGSVLEDDGDSEVRVATWWQCR